MKKVISFVLSMIILVSVPCAASADIPRDKIEALSYAQKTIIGFSVDIAIARKEQSQESEQYCYDLGIDLMDLSLEELKQLKALLQDEPESADPLDGIDIEPFTGVFSLESGLQSSLFKTAREVSKQLDWLVTPLVTRDGNPELSFDPKKQEIEYARFYLSYYGNVDKDEAKENVEEYTERLAAALSALYPNIEADMVCFFWKIPVISKDSLYSASFFYHTEDGILVNNDK